MSFQRALLPSLLALVASGCATGLGPRAVSGDLAKIRISSAPMHEALAYLSQ
jgi:hypothetical protein